MALTFKDYEKGYTNLWSRCKLLTGSASKTIETATRLIAPTALQLYKQAEAATGVPAGLIAAINYRESGGEFSTYLGNGDRLDRKTVNVPAGRGPFQSWLDGAIDALRGTERPSSGVWSIPFALYFAENFNGRGYQRHNENSPYVWSQTTLEEEGMFTTDHGYDPSAWDGRPGVAALFLAFQTVAPTLMLATVAAKTETPMSTQQPTTPADPLSPIINILGEVQSALPIFAGFIPAPFGAIVSIGVPALEDILKFLDQAKQGGVQQNSVAVLFEQLAGHFQTISAQLKKPTA